MRRAHRLSTQLPVPVIGIMARGFVEAVERRTTEEIAKGLHVLRVARIAEIAKKSKLNFRI
jgi:hypothetical protein